MTHVPACSVYFRPEAIFIFTQHVTEFGWGIAGEPFFRLDVPATAEALGDTVIESLKASRSGIPQPRDLKPITSAVLKFAGVKSWKAFTQEASLVLVSQEKDYIGLMPTVKSGSGFDHQPDKIVRCDLTPDALGNALLKLWM